MGLTHLAKQHGDKLIPTTETFGVAFGLGGMYCFKELAFGKKV
jgi:hypothetical protein